MPQVLTISPLAGYSDSIDSPCVVSMTGDEGEALRVQVGPVLHHYALSLAMTKAERATLDAFLLARTFEVESFYWSDPALHERTAVAMGTGDGLTTAFVIPTTGATSRDYPINDATAILKVNGTPVTATVNTDTRTFTASVPPAGGSTVTADYTFYRLVRLEGGIEWTVEIANYDMNTANITLAEIVGS